MDTDKLEEKPWSHNGALRVEHDTDTQSNNLNR